MKGSKETIAGVLIILLTGLIGILVPAKMFQIQEQKLLWNVGTIPFATLEEDDSDSQAEMEESEYKKIICSMDGPGATYYREPMPGQINMSKAVELAIQGINRLMGESLGQQELSINNFINIKAVLQTKEENYQAKPQYSFWNIQMSNENEVIHVWINSVSGMILKIDFDLYMKSDLQSVNLTSILDSYVQYSGFGLTTGKGETAGDMYHNSYENIYLGRYFNCRAAKYLCNFADQLDSSYVKVILALEE